MLSGKSGIHGTVISLFQQITTNKEVKTSTSQVNLAAVKTFSKLASHKLPLFSTDNTLTLPKPFIVETDTYHLNEKKMIIS